MVISKRQAEKVYPRNTEVIRRGDSRWTSDNHQEGRLGERYGLNPTSLMEQKILQHRSDELDERLLPSVSDYEPGDLVEVPLNDRDLVAMRLVEVSERTVGGDGDEYDRVRKYWKRAYIARNAAL